MFAYFACIDCKVYLFLGKAIVRGERVSYFHIGGPSSPRNAARPELTRSLWKMLADHAEHNLRVALQGDETFARIAEDEEFVRIGGDTDTDITFEEYLKDWPG
jgi:hypothetical protein